MLMLLRTSVVRFLLLAIAVVSFGACGGGNSWLTESDSTETDTNAEAMAARKLRFEYTGAAMQFSCDKNPCYKGNITGTAVFSSSVLPKGFTGRAKPSSVELRANGQELSWPVDPNVQATDLIFDFYDGRIVGWSVSLSTVSPTPKTVGMRTGSIQYVNAFYVPLTRFDEYGESSSEGRVIGIAFNQGTWDGRVPGSGNLANNLGYCGCSAVGNPINAGTGNKFHAELDFTAAAHTLIKLTRYYNSHDTSSTAFGFGWRSEWQRSISSSLSSGSLITQVIVTREDGRSDIFTRDARGNWFANPDVTSRLTETRDAKGNQTGWNLFRSDDSTETYSRTGRLLRIDTRSGQRTILAYSGSQLTSVTGPFGHQLSFRYSGSRIAQAITPAGDIYNYTYKNSNLVSIEYPGGEIKRYLYENPTFPHALTGIIDENGDRYSTYQYDTSGRAVRSEHAGGADSTSIKYHDGDSATVTDSRGASHTTAFTTQFALVKPRQTTGTPYRQAGGSGITYDWNGFIASLIDWNGNVTEYSHDARGNELTRVEASGTAQAYVVKTQWHPTYHLPTRITLPKKKVEFSYDSKGNLLERIEIADSKTRSWKYTYNRQGQILTAEGPRTNVKQLTRYEYDSLGNITSITNALGHITALPRYDKNGRPTRVVDPNGLTTSVAYDERGRVTRRSVGGRVTTMAYDKAGNLKSVKSPDGSRLEYAYDEAHRLIEVKDSLGNRKRFELDGNGNRTRVTVLDKKGASVRQASYEYNEANYLMESVSASGHVTHYTRDGMGNTTRVETPLGAVTSTQYDSLNRPFRVIDAARGRTTIGYDSAGRVASITDPRKLTTSYTYDGFDNLLSVLSPDAGLKRNAFDLAGNVVSTTDARGQATIYSYDALDRPLTRTYSGASWTFTYDNASNAIGRLVGIASDDVSTRFAYDGWGNLLSKRQAGGGGTLTQQMRYDAAGRLVGLTYPSGMDIGYAFDDAGQIASLTVNGEPFLNAIEHEPFGPVKGWVWASNNDPYFRAHDGGGRVSAHSLGSASRSLTYDPAGRITRLTDSNGPVVNYKYDVLDRLTEYASGSDSQKYGYDANGNRTSITFSFGSQTYSIDPTSNRLLSGAEVAYAFDKAGNVKQKEAETYTYDGSGLMSSSLNGFGITTSYVIDGHGQRVAKNSAGTVTTFMYGENAQLLGEYAAARNQESIYLEGLPVALTTQGAVMRVYADHLGTPRRVTAGGGSIVWDWGSEPFGSSIPTGTLTFNQRFPGQYFDAEIFLNYNTARHYDPYTGRYLQSDPAGMAGGINSYSYANSIPTQNVDPFGLVSQNWFADRPNDPNYSWGEDYSEFGTYTVLGHGSPTQFCGHALCGTPDALDMSASELARLIYNDPIYFPGDPVKLIACETGSGRNSYAQQLADELARLAQLAGHDIYSTVYAAEGLVRTPWLPLVGSLPPIVTNGWSIDSFKSYSHVSSPYRIRLP